MITTKHCIGSTLVSIETSAASPELELDGRVANDLSKLLDMMERASTYNRGREFSQCLDAFIDEINQYLEGKDPDSEPTQDEIDFVNEHLSEDVRKALEDIRNMNKKGRS
jgi:hypothetical protein